MLGSRVQESVETTLPEGASLSIVDDEFFGKCDDNVDLSLPAAMKAELARWASRRRMSKNAAIRLFIATGLRGAEHVASVAIERVSLNPEPAPDKPLTDPRNNIRA